MRSASETLCDQERVLAALRGSGAFWFDDLASILAQSCWHKLRAQLGLGKTDYGTARVLNQSRLADRNVMGCLQGSNSHVGIEVLSADVAERYYNLGLKFYSAEEILGLDLIGVLDRAVQTISGVQGAARAVSTVLSMVHVLKPASPEYDISYSDPQLPFSIFVGVDASQRPNGALRLAESVFHECMHLQLTLIEDQVPLVAGDGENHFSPWRRTLRPTSGILHALYVFRAIQDLLGALIASKNLGNGANSYMIHRLRDIDEEVKQLEDLSVSQDLTPEGKAFVARLQVGNGLQNFI
jgi:hypothetical protein